MRLRSALLAPRARRGTRWPRACAEPHAPPPPPPTADSGPVSKTAIDLGVQATYEYLRANTREHPALAACRARTAPLSGAQMQTPPEQGALLAFLVELTAARSVLEVGTYTGYSACAMALALPPGGRLVTCDVSEASMAVARATWAEAGVAAAVRGVVGPALATLDGLLASGEAGAWDFAYIDADKRAYGAYLERCLRLVRVGGLVAVDNTLWYGRVADAGQQDAQTRAIRDFNASVLRDPALGHVMLPVGDGLTLLRRRA